VGADLFKSAPDPFIGRTLDRRYEVLGRLGEGGAGVVYRGRQTQLGRFVAIKVLHQDAAAIPEWRQRFEREARALSALAHPNVVPVTDSGIDGGVPFLVMELLQGKTLADLIKEAPGPLPLWRALDIMRQTLRGLAFAHGKGIVHRDMKPANVFLQELPDQADHVRLLDFGMVKFLEGGTSGSRTVPENLTRIGVMIGTPAYMSPEQVKGASADARTDVYAAGVLLFELLAGRRPFVADSFEGYMGAHLTQPVPLLAKMRSKLPRAAMFQAVVERAMAKKAADRFKDADAMLTALEDVVARLPASVLAGAPAEARRRSAPHKVLAARPRSGFWRRAILLPVAVGVGIAGVAIYLRHDGAKPAEKAALPPEPPKKLAKLTTPPKKLALPAPPPAAPKPAPTPEPPTTTALAAPPPAPKPEPVLPAPVPPPEARAPVEDEGPAEQPEPAKQAKPPKARDQAKDEGQPRARARNPWKEPVPRAIKPLRDRIDRGVHLSQKALHPLYDFAHQNPGDPRPWLLLGRAYAQVDWYSDAVDRYVKADHVDSSSRGDPQMLADLIKAAAHPTAGRAAARAIHDIYGAEAIPAVEKAMKARASEREASARLTRLRESLPH
jgi:serine/threonine-protein kinase